MKCLSRIFQTTTVEIRKPTQGNYESPQPPFIQCAANVAVSHVSNDKKAGFRS